MKTCPNILLSVALVTCNRANSLERCLASLRAQSVQPFEVFVSDDSAAEESGRTRQVATKYGCVYSVGPRRGLYANRNFAALQCKGSHIRTMDDDHTLPAEHFAQCLEVLKSDPTAIWTTGEIGYLAGRYVGVAKMANQLGPSGVGEAVQDRDDNWAIADGSTIYPRQAFDRGFRMVEEFGFGSSYLEFGTYLYKNGWKCRCIPDAVIEHHAVFLSKPNALSHLFASICFNRYFRPDTRRLVQYLAPHWRSWQKLPSLFAKANRRWNSR